MTAASGSLLAPGSFFGDTVSAVAGDAVLSEVRHQTPRTVPPHRHAAAYFSLLLEGDYRETAGEVTIAYEPFTLVFHRAETEHTDTIGSAGCRLFFIELLHRWTASIDEMGDVPEHIVELHGGDATWLALRLYHAFLSGEAALPLTADALVAELCAYVAGVPDDEDGEPAWLGSVDALVTARYCERLNLDAIAAHAGVNASHLCRAYRRFRGRSIGDAIAGLRMQFVCRRLVQTRDSLSAIPRSEQRSRRGHRTARCSERGAAFFGAARRRCRSRLRSPVTDTARLPRPISARSACRCPASASRPSRGGMSPATARRCASPAFFVPAA